MPNCAVLEHRSFLPQLDLDDEDGIRKQPAKQNKKITKRTTNVESDSDLDLEYIPVSTR